MNNHTHKAIEDSYCLRDAEHIDGTNKYTFKYNFQWRNIIQEHLTVSVRSVKLWLAPRHLWVNDLEVHTSDGTTSTNFNTTITGSMSEFNDKLASLGSSLGYNVYYNPSNRRLVFDCSDNNYFNYTDTMLITAIMSEDLKVITGETNFHHVEVLCRDESDHITCFGFEKVWNREDVHVRASFIDLGYQNFLGVSNEQFIPPKEYPISFTDQKFTIELYDSIDRPVELPVLDNKDTLLIELILNSYS